MGKEKRKSTIVISSSDDDEDKESGVAMETGRRVSNSAPHRRNPKRAKRVSLSRSRSRPLEPSCFSDFDVVKQFSEEFDQGLAQFKVTSGSKGSKDQWVDKYKPSCLEDLSVHKKKVEEVKLWFEERLKNSVGHSRNNVIIISGQAGVGKSATVYAVADHFGVEVLEWNAPTPTVWQEHMHNSNSGMRYISKLDEFESFVERTRKYGLVFSSLTQAYPILLIDDLPVVNGKIGCERLKKCLHQLLQSVQIPTAILINDDVRSEYVEHHGRYWEELQLSLQNAGAFKVTFNPITVNSIKKVLSKICKAEKFEPSGDQIDDIAKASGGDIRHAITSLQYFSLKPPLMHSTSLSKTLPACTKEKINESGDLDDGFSMPFPFGKDVTLSLFHALGKFLHNKRENGSFTPDGHAFLLKEKFIRCPLKMDDPELVLSQAHGQARLVADFLHENVIEFVSEEAISDAWVVGTYFSDTDLLLSSPRGSSIRNFESENIVQSIAASVAVRGVLFGNANPVSRWHAIRRPKLWQVEQSARLNKFQMLSRRTDAEAGSSTVFNTLSATACEFRPALNWLGHRTSDGTEVYSTEDEHHDSSLDNNDNNNETDDEIEDW